MKQGVLAVGGAVRTMARPRGLSVTIAVLGVVTAVALLLVPIGTTLGRDPLLRLGALGAPDRSFPGRVDCGSPLSNLGGSDGVDFYEIARSEACRRATRRRVATAVSSGAVIALTGLLALTVTLRREPEEVEPVHPRVDAAVS